MPFHDGVYYPYPHGDSQGTHSSSGAPSLLSSAYGQPSPAAMTPSAGSAASGVLPPFKFRPRRESVDWRRIGALDVERVASELDVDALQEHVGAVTFCSLADERCQRCQTPVDPALVKLFRLAQFTVEWLLHCQGFLALNLRAAEERLAAGEREREQLLLLQRKQEQRVQALCGELKQRKKFIRTQQSLLAPRIISSYKCPHCEKSFIKSSFLQNHIQRRHPDEYDMQSVQADGERRSQIESLKVEIGGLKEQLLQQHQALLTKAAQEKEQESLHRDLQRELERFKAEEMVRMERKIEDSRDGIRREMEFLYSRNLQASRMEADQNQNQNQNQTQSQVSKREAASSPVQPDRELDGYKELQMQSIHKLEQQLKKQDRKWESRMHEIKAHHESEKNQLLNKLSGMQSSMSDQQRLREELGRRLQEQDHTISAQREQIKNISSNPPTKVVELPVIVAAPAPAPAAPSPPPPPEPKPKRVVLEDPPSSAPKLDPIPELSEEEKDSSSASEKKPVERRPESALGRRERVSSAALLGIKRELRQALEQTLSGKLEDLGVVPGQDGLKSREFNAILSRVHSRRESLARQIPEYWQHREQLASSLERRLRERRRSSEPTPEPRSKALRAAQVTQIRPRSSSLPASRVTQVMSGPPPKQARTPQAAPRARVSNLPKTSTPNTRTPTKASPPHLKTPPFSSEEEETDEDEEPPPPHRAALSSQSHWGRSPQIPPPAPQSNPSKARPAVKHSPVRPTPAESDDDEDDDDDDDDDDWSDMRELQEIDPKQLQDLREHNHHADQRRAAKQDTVVELKRRVEKSLAARVAKRPPGAVSILPERWDMVQDLMYTDLEENSDCLVSSLEDGAEQPASKPGRGSAPLRKSLDSPSTSVWGTSTGKGPQSGSEAGSTLRSNLVSLRDFSDSEDG